jgi:hypothetical protein
MSGDSNKAEWGERQKRVCELADLYRQQKFARFHADSTNPEIRNAVKQALASAPRVAELELLLGLQVNL